MLLIWGTDNDSGSFQALETIGVVTDCVGMRSGALKLPLWWRSGPAG